MNPKVRIFLLLPLSILFLGMAGRGMVEKGELKPELRLKLYNEAIRHYEKAEALYQSGQSKEALRELAKATKVVNAFPEAHDLAQKIYREQGKLKEAEEEEDLFRNFKGPEGASLYKLRDKLTEEIELRKASAPPPDIQLVPALLLSAFLATVLIFGMVFEHRRLTGGSPSSQVVKNPILLESFPSEEEAEVTPSWLFKLFTLLLPAPFLFLLIVLLGLRNLSEVLPVLLFCWGAVDAVVYLIFFADLSDLQGFRRPGGGAG